GWLGMPTRPLSRVPFPPPSLPAIIRRKAVPRAADDRGGVAGVCRPASDAGVPPREPHRRGRGDVVELPVAGGRAPDPGRPTVPAVRLRVLSARLGSHP